MQRDNPGVIAPPPLIYLVALLIGLALDKWLALRGFGLETALRWSIAAGLVLLGVSLIFAAIREFKRAGTNVAPYSPSLAVVDSGPYRFTRNPMYVGMALIHAGLALAADSLFALAMLVPALIVVNWGVIMREERYLGTKMGTPYAAYRGRVRRWV